MVKRQSSKGEAMRAEPDKKADDTARAVIGAAIEVHRVLGPGYLESVYEEAMMVEMKLRGIAFEQQNIFNVDYKGNPVGQGRLDLMVNGCVIAELKAVESLAPIHMAQVMSYLKNLRLSLGLLINFSVPLLRNGITRVVLSNSLGDLGALAVGFKI
jgi:GxxExxY protein